MSHRQCAIESDSCYPPSSRSSLRLQALISWPLPAGSLETFSLKTEENFGGEEGARRAGRKSTCQGQEPRQQALSHRAECRKAGRAHTFFPAPREAGSEARRDSERGGATGQEERGDLQPGEASLRSRRASIQDDGRQWPVTQHKSGPSHCHAGRHGQRAHTSTHHHFSHITKSTIASAPPREQKKAKSFAWSVPTRGTQFAQHAPPSPSPQFLFCWC
jgi:hypothetical protein